MQKMGDAGEGVRHSGGQQKEGPPKEGFMELAAFEVGHGDWTTFLQGEIEWGSTF